MNCPRCSDTILTMSHRTGIEIDFCPKCRGIWLDRGELDKIVERSEIERISERSERSNRGSRSEHPSDESGRYSRESDESGRYRSDQGRRRSWLSELFD